MQAAAVVHRENKRHYHKNVKHYRCPSIVGGEQHCYLHKRHIYIIIHKELAV